MRFVKFKDFIDYDKRIGKIIISGLEGSGKTLLLTTIAVGKMLHGLQDCWKSYDLVDCYNELGYNFTKNYEHLCFANFDINCSGTCIPDRKVYRCNPFRLGLFDPFFETNLYPPYSLFCISEAYNVFNAYLYNRFRDGFKGFIKTSRQSKFDFVLDTQYFGDICTIFRRITNRFIYLNDNVEEIKNGDGVVIGHKFHVTEWRNNRDVEVFESSGKKQNCEDYVLIVDKCFYENFDTDYCRYLALMGRQFQDYLIEHFPAIKTVDDVENLCANFGLLPEEGFFVSFGKSNKVKVNIDNDLTDEDDDMF